MHFGGAVPARKRPVTCTPGSPVWSLYLQNHTHESAIPATGRVTGGMVKCLTGLSFDTLLSNHTTFVHLWSNVGPASLTLVQHCSRVDSQSSDALKVVALYCESPHGSIRHVHWCFDDFLWHAGVRPKPGCQSPWWDVSLPYVIPTWEVTRVISWKRSVFANFLAWRTTDILT